MPCLLIYFAGVTLCQRGYQLWPCVCLSVTSRCSVKTDGRNNLFFLVGGGFFRPVLHYLLRKFRYLQKQGYLELFSKLWTYKILPRHIDRRRTRKMDAHSVINWDRRRRQSTKSIIPPSSDARPLQFIAQIAKPVYSTILSRGSINDS